MDAAQLRACRNYYVQLLKNLAADDGAQRRDSGRLYLRFVFFRPHSNQQNLFP